MQHREQKTVDVVRPHRRQHAASTKRQVSEVLRLLLQGIQCMGARLCLPAAAGSPERQSRIEFGKPRRGDVEPLAERLPGQQQVFASAFVEVQCLVECRGHRQAFERIQAEPLLIEGKFRGPGQ